MEVKNLIEEKITGDDSDTINRRKELWQEIWSAYKEGGKENVKNFLNGQTKDLTQQIENLIDKIEEKYG